MILWTLQVLMESLLASRSNGSLGKAENVCLADGWLCRWNCEALKRIVTLHWWPGDCNTKNCGLFIMSVNWDCHWQEIQILSCWIPFIFKRIELSVFRSSFYNMAQLHVIFTKYLVISANEFFPKCVWGKNEQRRGCDAKIQKSFGGTFNVPSPLYVPGLNVLAVLLVVLIQRASIVCLNGV